MERSINIINRDKVKSSGIYAIKNTINDKVYIGQANVIYNRIRTHISHLKKGKHHSILLQRFVNKYGIDKIYFEVVEITTENLTEREQWWIDNTDSFYNCNKEAGVKPKGWKHTPEAIEKIATASIGRSKSSETIELIRQGNIGKKRSLEAKQNIANGHTGLKLSPHALKVALSNLKQGKGSKHNQAKLNENNVLEIRNLLLKNKSFNNMKQIAIQFNVSTTSISAIYYRRSWKHVNN